MKEQLLSAQHTLLCSSNCHMLTAEPNLLSYALLSVCSFALASAQFSHTTVKFIVN